jgi:hypothetical protein
LPLQTRTVGTFLLAGKSQPVTVHEVLGLDSTSLPDWLSPFHDALKCFRRRDFDRAQELFRRVIELRGGHDGPSEFYLKELVSARQEATSSSAWDGVLKLSSK